MNSLTTTGRGRHRAARETGGVEGNARLTASLAVVIFVVLALEGLTILRIGNLLVEHVFIGALLIPPVLYKIGSTSWRFFKYYTGDAQYKRKGPPPTLLRLLGPILIVLTVVLLASGVALVYLTPSQRQFVGFVHRASFVLWFAVMTVHVLGHVIETASVAPRDWMRRTRRQVVYSSARQWLTASSLVLGVLVALVITPHAYGWWNGY
ncbi:MAG: hypothetical protein ACYC19_09705 [Acidimicrobiales bacterium]